MISNQKQTRSMLSICVIERRGREIFHNYDGDNYWEQYGAGIIYLILMVNQVQFHNKRDRSAPYQTK